MLKVTGEPGGSQLALILFSLPPPSDVILRGGGFILEDIEVLLSLSLVVLVMLIIGTYTKRQK